MLARRLCSIGTALFAALRAAVPTRGRRSLACVSLVLRQDCESARPAARGGADREVGVPSGRANQSPACAPSGLHGRSLRGAQRSDRRSAPIVPGSASLVLNTWTEPLERRGAVPTRGRRPCRIVAGCGCRQVLGGTSLGASVTSRGRRSRACAFRVVNPPLAIRRRAGSGGIRRARRPATAPAADPSPTRRAPGRRRPQ